MADFVAYAMHEKVERDPRNYGGLVHLIPDRWALLVDHIRESAGDPNPGDTIKVYEPVQIGEITFLPAVYRPV